MASGPASVGTYSLVEPLGEDARCSRWRATVDGSATEVLVTRVALEPLGGAEGVARFRAEVRRAMQLTSPFVALVLDEGVAEGTGEPYVVTELLRGHNLADQLAGVRLRARDVARYVSQLGDALSEAAEQGIVHLDLRPENFTIVGEPGEEMLKIQDFGVAAGVWAASPAAGLAFAQSAPLAASYMSPELLRASAQADRRSDLWSLAVIAFECLTGRHPFEVEPGASRPVTQRVRAPGPVPSSRGVVPVGFDAWFARATASDVGARFQTADELAGSLHAICCRPETLGPGTFSAIVPASAPVAAGSTAPRSVATGLVLAGNTVAGSALAGGAGARVSGGALAPRVVDAGGWSRIPLLAGFGRQELRFLFAAGVLLGLCLFTLAALWRHQRWHGHERAAPIEAVRSLAPASTR